jgi:hypothetical protein
VIQSCAEAGSGSVFWPRQFRIIKQAMRVS